MLDWQFDDNSQLVKGYKHLHIPVNDVDDENLLTWFPKGNLFIEEGLNYWKKVDAVDQRNQPEPKDGGSGVLVHW